MGKIREWWRRRKGNKDISCKIRVAQYTYTIAAALKDEEMDPVILLYHCQAIAERLCSFRKEDIDSITPEAMAYDCFRPHLESGYGYDDVKISWKRIENNGNR